MQQTRFDQWIRKKFAYETWISTHRFPTEFEFNKKHTKHKSFEGEVGKEFEHLFIFRNELKAEEFIQNLRTHQYLFSASVEFRKTRLARFLCVRQRSVTYSLIQLAIFSMAMMTVGVFLIKFLLKEDVQASLGEFITEVKRLATQ